MGLNTDGEEMSPGSTVPDGLECTENTFGFEQQPRNEKSLPKNAACDSKIQDQNPIDRIGIEPFSLLHNLQRQHPPDITNTDHNEAKEQYSNGGHSTPSATSHRPYSDSVNVVDDTLEPIKGAPLTSYTDTPVDLAESISPPTPVEILELLDSSCNDDWDAMYETLLKEMQFGNSDLIEQDLPINPDVDLIDEEGYTPLYKAALKGHLKSVDELISQGANSNKPSKGGLTPLHASAQEGHEDIVDYLILQGADVNVECDMGRTPLHTAAEKGHTNIIESFFAEGTDVNKKDNTGWTPFSAAVQNGHLEAVKYLMAYGAKQNRYDGMTPLHAAAEYGHLDLVKFFISDGADVNEENDSGRIPLHGAAIHGSIAVMEYLIQQGSDVNKHTPEGWTPFNAAVQYGHLRAVKYLIDKGAKQNRYGGMTPLFAAAHFGHLDLVKFFISEGADVSGENDNGMNPLHGASIKGSIELIEYLIQQGSDVNKGADRCWTPFNAAVYNGHLEAVKYLIGKGAKESRYDGMTPLYLAAQSGHLDIVKFFIFEGADVNEEHANGGIPLHSAAAEGHVEVMKYLIQQGSFLNKGDEEGWTPFNAAVYNGHLEAVKYLIDKGAKQNRHEGLTPLFAAAYFGHLDLVKFFVSEGADVNEENDNGMIPLHSAAINGSIELIEYLIQQGSDVNKSADRCWTPFNAAVYNGHLEAVKCFIDKEAKQNRYCGMTPLFAAAYFGHLDIVKFFVSEGADVNGENDNGWIPLHGAAIKGSIQVMEYLIQQGSEVNKGDAEGWTPFNAAVLYGHLEAVKCLIDKEPKQSRHDGMTPLYLAALSGHLDIVKFFIFEGADVNEEHDNLGIPLHGAAAGGHMEVMEYLIQLGSDLNKSEVDGWTPFYAAVCNGHLEAVKYLIANGAKENKLDGMTPSYVAAQGGHLDCLDFFISNGADVNEEDEMGQIPLHGAAARGHLRVLEYLVQQRSDVNKKDHTGWTPFHFAVRNGHLEAVKLLMVNGAQGTGIHGMTPLYIATQYGHVEVAKHLLSKGFNVNDKGECGRSPLHAACYNGSMDVVKYLVGHNANVNEQDRDGWTPLHAAAQAGHRDVVEFLTLNGGDITAKDMDGTTPLQEANREGHTKIIKYLTQHFDDTMNEDTNNPRYGSYHEDAQGHRTSSQFEALIEDEGRYDSEVKAHIRCPAKCFDSENSFDAATVDSMDGCLAETDGKDFSEIHSKRLPTVPHLSEKEGKDELNPFVSARLKFPEKTSPTTQQKYVGGSKVSMPVERESRAGRDRSGIICPAQHDILTHGFTKKTGQNAFSLLNGSPTWKHGCFDQSFLHATETNYHHLEETEPRRHDILEEPFSSMDARNDQPTRPTENEENCERTILSNQLLDHANSYDGNPFFTRRTSLHSEWKKKKKRRSVDNPCSSFLVLVQSFLHMIIALAIILAGSPVAVSGGLSTEPIILRAGQPAVIPFDISRPSDDMPHVSPYFTLRFESKLSPFCENGENDMEGFKSPSQFPRFTISVAETASTMCVKVNIDPVDIEDEDIYVLRAFFRASENLKQEIAMKEILVQIPPGPAKCFLTISENNNYPYEVHCQATTGSTETTLTCYQCGQRVEVKGNVTDNGQVTRAVFLLPDHSPFSCCSHDVTSEVNVTMCNDFEWPPSNNHISSPTVNDPNLTPSVANTVAPIGNTEQASNTLVESPVDSGTCKPYMASSVSLTMGLMIYLLLC